MPANLQRRRIVAAIAAVAASGNAVAQQSLRKYRIGYLDLPSADEVIE